MKKQTANTFLNTIGLAIILVLSFTQCKKIVEKENSECQLTEKSPNASRTIADIVIPSDANEEMIRIYNDVQNPDYEVAIIDNPNYGMFSSSQQYDIYLGGMTGIEDEISISLNGNIFTPNPSNGQWQVQGLQFKDYIGTNVQVKIKSGEELLKETSIYVPKAHLTPKLGSTNSIDINRTGNTITWEPDLANVSGKIILFYHLYDANDNIIDTDGQMLSEADGSFTLDPIISDANIKKIQYSLISGNTVSTMVNGKKLLFYINTRDHHEYYIN